MKKIITNLFTWTAAVILFVIIALNESRSCEIHVKHYENLAFVIAKFGKGYKEFKYDPQIEVVLINEEFVHSEDGLTYVVPEKGFKYELKYPREKSVSPITLWYQLTYYMRAIEFPYKKEYGEIKKCII